MRWAAKLELIEWPSPDGFPLRIEPTPGAKDELDSRHKRFTPLTWN
jgi:hypothetical protein